MFRSPLVFSVTINISMPRLSLYRPNKTSDYEFLDKVIYEQFSIGGTDIFVHKFLGPDNPSVVESTADKPSVQRTRNDEVRNVIECDAWKELEIA